MIAWLMRLVVLAQSKQALAEVWPHVKTIGEELGKVLTILAPASFSLKVSRHPSSTEANELYQRLTVQGIPEDEVKHVLAAAEAIDDNQHTI